MKSVLCCVNIHRQVNTKEKFNYRGLARCMISNELEASQYKNISELKTNAQAALPIM